MTKKTNTEATDAPDPKNRFSNFTKTVLLYAVLALTAFTYTATVFKRKEFGDAQINELLFYAFNGLNTGNADDVIAMMFDHLILFFIALFLLLLPVVDLYRNKIKIKINLSIFGKHKTSTFNPSNLSWKVKYIYAGIMCSLSVWFLLISFQVPQYLTALTETSQIYEEHYVDPSQVEFEIPENPNNLIVIYLESMENTLASTEAGGQISTSLIPELENIAMSDQNVSFSHASQGIGGAQAVTGTTWTAASLVSHQLGVPIISNISNTEDNEYGNLNKFFPGTYGMGEVLNKAGYNQSFAMGSDAAFGGRDKLLTQHGPYKILDHNYARKEKLIPKDYKVWWGYEDKKLIEFSKGEIERLAAEDKPFNFQMLTVDTHFADGYLDETCPTPYEHQYDNVYACSSSQVAGFVDWVQNQPFADNTTIVIVGDHLGMQQSYYDELMTSDDYIRTTYNAIINPNTEYEITQPRQYAAFDMYPTILASIGIKIPGERLGLGTNLFAQDHKTLLEKYGSLDKLNYELSKRSDFYDRVIITGLK